MSQKPNSKPETALGAALKSAVQTLSKKKQTEMIADHLYSKYAVFKQFRPLAIGVHEALIALLPQFDAQLVARVLSQHCKKPRYVQALSRGGKRYDLNGKEVAVLSPEEVAEAKARYAALETARNAKAGAKPEAETTKAPPAEQDDAQQ